MSPSTLTRRFRSIYLYQKNKILNWPITTQPEVDYDWMRGNIVLRLMFAKYTETQALLLPIYGHVDDICIYKPILYILCHHSVLKI